MDDGPDNGISSDLGTAGWVLVAIAVGAGILFGSLFLRTFSVLGGGGYSASRHYLFLFSGLLIRLRILPEKVRYCFFLFFLASSAEVLVFLFAELFSLTPLMSALSSAVVTLVVVAPLAWKYFCHD
ncbi:MAG TPA: hypothetical protein PKI32_08040 [Opitutales bacterium]|nr:hypothetical protein [Opitutales bacterium]